MKLPELNQTSKNQQEHVWELYERSSLHLCNSVITVCWFTQYLCMLEV